MSHENSSSSRSFRDHRETARASLPLAGESLRDAYLEDYLAAWIECGEQTSEGVEAAAEPGCIPEDQPALSDKSLEMVRRADQCAALLALAWPASHSDRPNSHESLAADLLVAREPTSRLASGFAGERPRAIGRLEIRQRLGSGGMGQVFLAYDPLIRREVAVKIPLPGHWQSSTARARFLREARAAGKLRHTNILPVFDSGENDDGCFIVTQFVPGPTLANWLKGRSSDVPPTLAARIVARLADAMAHAHSRGVLHRDLKPSNILLMPWDVDDSLGKDSEACVAEKNFTEANVKNGACESGAGVVRQASSDAFPFEPLIADFGLAAGDFDEATLSADGQLLGTAVYMSPEQAAGESDRIGPRTDVYALGLILYEMLTGTRPFQRDTLLATLAAARHESPIAPRKIRPELTRDIESICLFALRANPERRYASAADFRDDLNRYLEGEPVRARRPRVWERLSMWSRRHPTVATLTSALAMGVMIAFVAAIWHGRTLQQALDDSRRSNQRAERAEQEARRRKEALEHEVYAVDMATAHRFWKSGDTRAAVDMLRRHLPNSKKLMEPNGGPAANSSLELDKRGWEWHYLWRKLTAVTRDVFAHQGAGYWVQFDSSGRKLFTAGADGFVRVFAVEGLAQTAELSTGQGEVNGLDWHESTGLLATAGDDGSLRLWRLESRTLVLEIRAHQGKVFAGRFLEEGRRVATCGTDRFVRIWETASGKLEREFGWHDADVEAIDIACDGERLASACSDGNVRIWNWKTQSTPLVIAGGAGRLSCVGFSPDGSLVAASSVDGHMGVWEANTGQRRLAVETLDGIQSLTWMPDGKTVIAATRSGIIQETDVDLQGNGIGGGLAERKWRVDEKRVYRVAMSPDGQQGASVGAEGVLRVWDPRRESEPVRELRYSHPEVEDADLLTTNGDLLFADANQVGVVTRSSGQRQWLENTPLCAVYMIAASNDQRSFFLGTIEEGSRIGKFDDLRSTAEFSGELLPDAWHGAFTPDGRRLITSSRKRIEITDLASGRQIVWPADDSYRFAVSPDGRWLAFSRANDVILVDLLDQVRERRWKGHASTIFSLAFSQDGKLLATASGDRRVKIWDCWKNQEIQSLEGFVEIPDSLAFSVDSRTLFVAGTKLSTQLWHVPTGRRLFDLDVQLKKVLVGPLPGQLAGVEWHRGIWICDLPTYSGSPTR